MYRMILNESDITALTTALRVAAEVYRADALKAIDVGQERVAAQFVNQAYAARKLIEALENLEDQ